jgi:hypothetical protein
MVILVIDAILWMVVDHGMSTARAVSASVSRHSVGRTYR